MPTLEEVQTYWQDHPAGEAQVARLAADRRDFFDERDRQTLCYIRIWTLIIDLLARRKNTRWNWAAAWVITRRGWRNALCN